MKLLTANLTSKALDWALNHALMLEHGFVPEIAGALGEPSEMYEHTDPAVCLWLIKQYRMDIDQVERYPDVWIGAYFESTDGNESFQDSAGYVAETLEQAVARCVVQIRLGGEVDVPDELGVVYDRLP